MMRYYQFLAGRTPLWRRNEQDAMEYKSSSGQWRACGKWGVEFEDALRDRRMIEISEGEGLR